MKLFPWVKITIGEDFAKKYPWNEFQSVEIFGFKMPRVTFVTLAKNTKKPFRENYNPSVKILELSCVKNLKLCVKKLVELVRETQFLPWKFWKKACVKTVSLREKTEKNGKKWFHARVFFSRREKKTLPPTPTPTFKAPEDGFLTLKMVKMTLPDG